jgi:hypothetical protein
MNTPNSRFDASLARLALPPSADRDADAAGGAVVSVGSDPSLATTVVMPVAGAGAAPPPPADPVLAANDLANTLARASARLFDERRDNPEADAERLLNLERVLDQQAIDLRTQSLRLLGARAGEAVAALQAAAQRADAYLAQLQRLENSLGAITATLSLAGAALVGDAGGVLDAAVHLDQAIARLRARDAVAAKLA